MIADPQAMFNRALVLHQTGQLSEAESLYRHMLTAFPENGHLLHNLALIRFQHGHLDEAIALIRRGLQTEPHNAKFLGTLGGMLSAAGQHDEAVSAFDQATQGAASDDPELLGNQAIALGQLGRLSEALAACQRSLQLRPGHVDTLNTLGNLLTDSRRLQDAAAVYRQALAIRADAAKLHSNLLLLLNYDDSVPAAALIDEHRAYGAAQAAMWDALPVRHDNTADRSRRLRVGYLSTDFGAHPVGYLLGQTLAQHDRCAVEVVLYATRLHHDALAQDFESAADLWRDCSRMPDDEIESTIHQDRIDILIELGGHTAGNRLPLMARRPAPVQLSYLGYPTTTGLAAVGYRLTDAIIDPPGGDAGSEQPLHLRHGIFRYAPPASAPAPSTSPMLARGVPTFGCFCNLSKVTPSTIALWCQLLQRCPQSRLLLKAKALADDAVRSSLLAEFASHGIDKARIELRGWTDLARHLADYADIDVMLDTQPFNLATNTCEALWMGVPVITRVGDRPASRLGASLLTTAGQPQWIAYADAAFVETASGLVSDAAALDRLRQGLRGRLQAARLLDTRSLAAELDELFRRLWLDWCDHVGAADHATERPTVLHVGCGSLEAGRLPTMFARDRWHELRLDIDEQVKPDFVASITDMRAVPDQVAQALYSSHNVEHLFPHEVQPALREFARVLSDDGFALIVVPDLQVAAERVLRGDLEAPVYQSPAGPVSALDMIYGASPLIEGGNLFMLHKTGFTAESLRRHLAAAGFKRVAVQRRAYALWAVGHKR